MNTLVTSRARRVALPLLLVVNLMMPLAAGPAGAIPGASPRALAQVAPAPASGLPGSASVASWPAAVLSRGPAAGRGVVAAPVPPRVPPLLLSHDAAARGAAPVATAYGSLPMAFEPNQGQTDPRVRYLARGGGYTLFLTGSDAVLSLNQSVPQAHGRALSAGHGRAPGAVGRGRPDGRDPRAGRAATSARTVVVRLRLIGAAAHPRVVGLDRLPGVVNYLIGRDRRRWHTGIPTFARVAYQNVLPGVSLAYYGTRGRLEYDYVLAPGVHADRLRLAVEGVQGLRLDRQGNLQLPSIGGMLRQDRPLVYQVVRGRRQVIPGRYIITAGREFGVAVGRYDRRRPLVIDPVLSYSTYLSGSSGASANGIAVDAAGDALAVAGDAFVAGATASLDFPILNPIQGLGTYQGSTDAFVSKLNAAGTALVYSTYLGGNAQDQANGIAVDATGAAYVTGDTSSQNFPIYPPSTAFQRTSKSSSTCFIAKLSPSGASLAYSTYLGGSLYDHATAIVVDGAGAAYVTGFAYSTDFPTQNAFQSTNYPHGEGHDAFVVKLNASGTLLVYGTYLGGSTAYGRVFDVGNGIALDATGAAYVTGSATSTDFPTQNAFQATMRASLGNGNAFVTKFTPAGSALAYSTYLGGAGGDLGNGIAVDAAGAAYVTGSTSSTDFPAQNAFQSTNHGSTNAFVTKFTPTGTALAYSTYLGGTSSDSGNGIAVDATGKTYVTGSTSSTNFPTQNALQPTNHGSTNAFVTALNAAGSALVYSTYLGGGASDTGSGIAVDGTGQAYVAGSAQSTNFPTTGALPGTHTSSTAANGFVTKIGLSSGMIPWHPHQGMAVGGDASVSVDLADGHVDVSTSDMSIPARGPGLGLSRTWDSTIAASGASPTGGWSSSLTPRMGGMLTSTVLYTDTSGAVWAFPYLGSPTDASPYAYYSIPPGKPWRLSTSSSGYVLTNFLSGEVMTFDASGRLTTDQDSYGNTNTMSYGSGSATSPSQEANSGGRTLAFSYQNGLLSDAQSPLWQSSGGTQGQHVTYAYNGSQLTGITRGAGTPDAVTTTFGYSGAQLTTITSPLGEAFTLGYDGAGRLVSLTSPLSGTAGQAGYTPSYTTRISYLSGATQVVRGYGTTSALTTAYNLDGQGQATSVSDGLGHTTSSTYDADHDVLTSTDANNNTTTNTYIYVESSRSVGLLTQTSSPPVASDTLGATPASLVTGYSYGSGYDLTQTYLPNGGTTLNTYDGYHGLYSSTRLVSGSGSNAVWRGAITVRDGYGEPSVSLDPRGVSVGLNGTPVQFGPQSSSYQSRSTYDPQGDLQTSATPPITTTTAGVTTTAPVITSYGYDGDGNQTSMTTPNGNKTTYVYDGLGRQVQTIMPPVPVVPAGSSGIGPHLRLGTHGPATAVAWQRTDTAVPERRSAAVGRLRSVGARGLAQRRAGLSTANRQRAMTPARVVARHSDGIAPDTTTVIVGRPTPPTVTIPTVTIAAPGQTTTPVSTTTLASPTISMPATMQASPTTSAPTAPAVVSATAAVSATASTIATTPTAVPTPVTTTLPSDISTSTPVTALIALPPPASATPPVAAGLITATTALTNAAAGLGAGQLASYGRLPLSFEANQGQTDGRVRYLARGAGYGLYLTGTDAVLALTVPATPTVSGAARDALDAGAGLLTPTAPLSETAVRLRYVGSSAGPAVEGQQRLPGDANYLMGSDPSGWHTGIPTYARVVYRDVYPGIDLAYHGTQGRLEYDWTVAPGASVAALTLAVDGARGLSQEAHGALSLRTAAGVVRLYAPSTYQTIGGQRRAVASRYVLTGGTRIGVAVGAYDATRPLVIDPVLGYSTYLGGSSGNSAGNGIAVDGAGSAYVVGSTTSPNFPRQNAYNGGVFTNAGNDVFVTKFAPDGQSLAYSTYLGGNGDTQGLAIAVGGAGNAYLTGFTWANNYPIMPGAYQTTPGGGNDVFVTELGATGNSLVYSTYLGGGAYESGQALALDGQGHVYVTGNTVYDNAYGAFPTTPGAFQTTFSSQGSADPRNAFLAELDPSKSGAASLLYSTFLGGSGLDEGHGLAVGAQGIVVTGWTSSGDFPTTANALQGAFGSGTRDAFLSVLAPDLRKTPSQQLVYSTFLGSSGDNEGAAVAVDASGSMYIAGSTTGGFPATATGYQRTPGGGAHDAFLARVSMDGGLAYGTYLGGADDDVATGVAVDGSSNAYVTGYSGSTTFPTTNAFQPTNKGQVDAFVAEVGAGLTGTASLLSSSYLGGSGYDAATAIALDSVGNAYVTGQTNSTDFTTLTPYSSTAVGGGTNEAFVTKVGTALVRGTIGTVAGVGGAYAYSGDGGRATAAQLSYPIGAPAVDSAGDLFFSDTSNGRVREVLAANGAIVTVAGTGAGGFGGDGGPASAALVSAPEGVALDAAGDLFIADTYNNRVREVRATNGAVGPTSTIVTVAGTGAGGFGGDGGLATAAQLNYPTGLAVDRAGNLYIADYYNSRVREVRAVGGVVGPASTIVTVAGGGNPADGVGDGGLAGLAGIYYPTGVALDGAGNLYVADRAHYRVREVLAMGGSIGATSVITTVAGTGSVGYNGDGIPATTAMLVDPTGVAVDAAGNLYIADYAGRRVRAVLAAGGGIGPTSLITTVAGTGNAGYNGDNIPAATAQLTEPWGVATDAAGNLYIVDTYGQRVREVGGVGPVSVATTTMAPTSSTRYDGDGHAVSTTDANGHTSLSAYDPLGRLVIQTNPISGTSIMTYSATELQQEQDEQGNVTTYAYDAAGQTTVRSDPISGTTQFAYDSAGNTTSLTDTDTSGNVLQVETPQYDALNRQIADVLTGPGGPVLTGRTAYTRDGQIAQIQQPNGDTTSNTYDTAGELVSRSFTPASGTGSTTYESYGYDAAGDPTTYTDPDGRTTTITYDATSYAMGKLSTGGTTSITTTVGYDSDGNTIVQAAQTSDTGLPGRVQIDTRTATYDTNDRQVSTVDDGLVTVHAYDAQGQVRVGTVMDGQLAVATVLDAEGRATAIGEGTGANGPLLYASNFGYNANDLLQTLTLPGGVQEAFQYDANNWIVSVTALGPSTGGTVTSLNSPYAYGYDALGHLTSATTLSGTDVLSYDGIGRLVAESGPQLVTKAHTVHWTYDNNGNILTATGDSGATDVYTYTPGMANELQQVGTTGDPLTKTVTYGYDALGDINSIANPVGTTNPADPNAINTHITYDSRGRPVQVTYLDSTNGSKVTTITISYNASDQRSHYMITPQGQPTLDTQFQYRNGELGQQQVISDTANGPVTLYTNTYIYGPDGAPLYVIHTQPGHAPARYWYVWDGQGNVTALTDANGTVVDRYAYDQWGELTSNDGANEHVPQQLRYKGYYYDEKISWYWLGGRYYDPETERYLQPGSNAGDGTRSYVYAADDPARRQFAAEAARYQKGTNLGIPKKVYSPRRTTGLPPSVPPGIPPVNAPSQVPGGCATGAMARILRGDIGGQTNVASSIVAGTDPATGIPYDRGHLLGANLGGSNTDPANFVAETVNANRGAMQILENKVRTLARLNYGVLYQVEPAYLIGPVRSVGNLCIPNLVHVTIGRTSITTNPGQPDFYEFNASAAVAPSGQPEFIYGGTLCGVGDFLVPNLVGNTSQATLASRAPIPSSIVPGLGNNVTNRDCTTPTV